MTQVFCQILLKKALEEKKLEGIELFLLHSIKQGRRVWRKIQKKSIEGFASTFPWHLFQWILNQHFLPPPPTKHQSARRIIFTNIIFYLKKLCSFFYVERWQIRISKMEI